MPSAFSTSPIQVGIGRDRLVMLTRYAILIFWRSLALCCVVLGIAGAFLPVLPTTPFLLVAAWAGSKGWPQLERWLVEHPRWGTSIRRWCDHRAVPRSAKWAASATMLFSSVVLVLSAVPLALKIGVPLLMSCVAAWLWLRPEG
ncbi:YbaN family protein [Piscinibacter sakaiensis]|uniref:YbaN family protein n=1 Tax=Piscinibacter sakaiensis TaxID=1547922 RepID=UPI003AABA5AE